MKERCRDIVGLRVMLLRRVETLGGDVFHKGTTMIVAGTYRGRFELNAVRRRRRMSCGDDPKPFLARVGVRRMARRDFELLEPIKRSPPRRRHRWEKIDDGIWDCSVCELEVAGYYPDTIAYNIGSKYCPGERNAFGL